jgi:hypothetical protein
MIIHFPVIIWNWKINEDNCDSSFFCSILIPSFFMKCMRKERNLMVKPRKSREQQCTIELYKQNIADFQIFWYCCLLNFKYLDYLSYIDIFVSLSNIIGSSYTLCDTFIITLKSIGHRINMHYGRLKWSNNIK